MFYAYQEALTVYKLGITLKIMHFKQINKKKLYILAKLNSGLAVTEINTAGISV